MTVLIKREFKEKSSKKKLVLLDAHAIIHRAYHALPDFVSSKGEPTGALYGLSAMIIKIANEFRPNWIIATYDLPKPTHRHEVYKDYKAGRAKADEELVAQLKTSRELLSALAIPIYDKEGFEADDILGTIVEILGKEKTDDRPEIIIASGDMDTLQLVSGKDVLVYTLKRGIQDTVIYDEDAVVKRFGFSPTLLPDYKGLCGDQSDNIIGIKGIGEKTASTLIQKFGSLEKIYETLEKDREIFIKAGIKERVVALLKENKEEAEFSKILASIRRDAPIHFSLPEKTWAKSVDLKIAESFFSRLEFRTMAERLKQAIAFSDEDSFVQNKKTEAIIEGPIGREEVEAGIMLWLINSSITNPKINDIFSNTGKENLKEAIEFLSQELQKKGLFVIYEKIEKPLIDVVDKMNKKGIAVDTEYLSGVGKEYRKRADILEKKIWKEAGLEFNVNSPKQLGEILFSKLGLKVKNQKKTGAGALSTKESELKKIRETHPIISLILEYRELAKLLSTYIENLIPLVGSNGRLRAKFLQAGTTTGRMASESPNLQNIPNHTELGMKIRRAFRAERNKVLVAFDYSQIELRIAAFLSGDERLISIFKTGLDVHTSVASAVFGVLPEAVDKEMRRRAKVINFGVMYGMGVNALKDALGSDRKEAERFYKEYFRNFSGLADYLDKVKKETAKRGYTETLFGRRRYFEGFNSKLPFIRSAAERMAINAPIQGTEADIIKLAMVGVDKWILREKLGDAISLVLQVHDELVYEVDEGLVEKTALVVKKLMEEQVDLDKTKGVPIVVDVSVGANWGEMNKL